MKFQQTMLLILDGWGYRTELSFNAIAKARTPTWDHLWQHYPHCLLSSSGTDVGLPCEQMGNSEVGHLHIGAGRLLRQELSRIDNSIETGDFFNLPEFINVLQEAKKAHTKIHVLGLLSAGGVHSHERHIFALCEFAKKYDFHNLQIHAILDGRDTPPKSARASLELLEQTLHTTRAGHLASICGRYYAMDRDKRWDRIQIAYDHLCTPTLSSNIFVSAIDALTDAYHHNETDEFVKPRAITAKTTASTNNTQQNQKSLIEDGDSVIFMNFRADRTRQLSYALTKDNFQEFRRKSFPKLANFLTLTQYASDLQTAAIFKPINLSNSLGEFISKQHLKQFRIAETEKYAHVTYFFNGGEEQPFPLEDRLLIPSPQIATYDLQPQMSVFTVTEQIIQRVMHEDYALIVANFANADMVGHCGNFQATLKAIQAIDECLSKLVKALFARGYHLFITADHGNAEMMFDQNTTQAHTAHTSNPVPLLYTGKNWRFTQEMGTLADIAPTLLHTMGFTPPTEMTGEILLARS